MLEELKKGEVNMVIGSRFIENKGFQSSSVRRMGINYFTGLIKMLTGTRITNPNSGLRMVDDKLINFLRLIIPLIIQKQKAQSQFCLKVGKSRKFLLKLQLLSSFVW